MRLRLLSVVATAALLVACGGGGDGPTTTPTVTTSSVKVVGDSLNDSGTFGFKFTVQGNSIWTDRVAAALGAPTLCPRYAAVDANTVVPNPSATACTSYGVGGGRVNPAGTPNDTTPFSIIQQLTTLAAEKTYRSDELLLVDGGGNDVADLVGAYLNAGNDGGAAYSGLLLEVLTPGEVGGAGSSEAAGALYMSRLADLLVNTINAQAISRGARRVVVITAPDVTQTPRFRALLAGIALSNGQAAADAVQAVTRSWVVAFNDRLRFRLNTVTEVALVDFYAELNRWIATPGAFGLTNVIDTACPSIGTDIATGLPAYNIAACTEAVAAANTAPADWRTYIFSDNFHGTPRTNQLVADVVLQALTAKGWR